MSDGHPDARVVVRPPRTVGSRRVLGALVVLAFFVGAAGFGYAIFANSRSTHHAQETADRAARTQLYALQLFCTMIDRELRTRGDEDRRSLARYYDELDCKGALEKPRVPLGQTGTRNIPPRHGTAPSPSSRAGPPSRVSSSPAPSPASTRTPGPSPSRHPSPSPSRTPSPSPSACVTAGPFHVCVPPGVSAFTGRTRVAAVQERQRGRHYEA